MPSSVSSVMAGDPTKPVDVDLDPASPGFAGNVLRIPVFRKMWAALGLASLGDWLGFLAFLALAKELSGGGEQAANAAVAVVLLMRLAPALLLAPFAGVVADRLDRRWAMVAANFARAVIVMFVPFVDSLWFLFLATLLLETASLFFIPAKEATMPNLVPRARLESANAINLLTTYGAAAPAAVIFIALAASSGLLNHFFGPPFGNHITLTLWINGLVFVASALIILPLREISRYGAAARTDPTPVFRAIAEGWRYIARTPLVRALVVGMLGAFAAGGVIIGLAPTHVVALGAGDAGFALLFALVFLGLAAGMGGGPWLAGDFCRRRLFGLCLAAAGFSLTLLALVPNMVVVALLTFVLGALAGIAWVTGYTLLGLEVTDDVRGRTFAFVQSMVRVVLLVVIAAAPGIAAIFGNGFTLRFGERVSVQYTGTAITLLLAGLVAATLGILAYRSLDDRGVRPLDRVAPGGRLGSVTSRPFASGFFLAFEGGEGTGKSTQAQRLADALRGRGFEVVLTREPGATEVGLQLRQLLLHATEAQGIAPRAEALLYAADRAEHVDKVIRPALERGAIVISDRYVDSSLAYQGAGRVLEADDILQLSAWATGGLRPHLTVVLDLSAEAGLRRVGAGGDRLESEPLEFHERVRQAFLARADAGRGNYVVIDAASDVDTVAEQICARVTEALATRERGVPDAGTPAAAGPSGTPEASTRLRVPRFRRLTPSGGAVEVSPASETVEMAAGTEHLNGADGSADDTAPLGVRTLTNSGRPNSGLPNSERRGRHGIPSDGPAPE